MGYKLKPNKGVAKRLRVTATGKLKHSHELTSHLRSSRSAKKKRHLGRPSVLDEGHARRFRGLLAISGRLNLQMGGPGVMPPIPKELFAGVAGWSATRNDAEMNRRSIYIFARRNLRFPFLEVFDAPDSNISCPARERSTTAPQSLTLLNSDEVMRAAQATAGRIAERVQEPEKQVRAAYANILGRSPSATELSLSRTFLERLPLSELCRALFNLNDFVYLP